LDQGSPIKDLVMTPYPLAGLAIALAGADKLLGQRAYKSFFGDLGWSETEMRQVGGAELLGGLLMALKPTRRLGAGIVIAASARVLGTELKQDVPKAAAARAGLLLAAVGALVAPG
jgi:hypothetical protein